MNIELITAFTAITGVIVSIVALIRQSRDTHIAFGIQLLRDYEKQFESETMRKFRTDFANLYLQQLKGVHRVTFEEILEHSYVVDFFTMVGILLKRRAIDPDLTSATFSYWIMYYWEVVEDDINKIREIENDRDYWMEFEYLYQRMLNIEEKRLRRHGQKYKRADQKTLIQFLDDEANLVN